MYSHARRRLILCSALAMVTRQVLMENNIKRTKHIWADLPFSWNFSSFSVTGDINENMFKTCDVSCAVDHVIRFTRHSPSIFAYCMRSKTGAREGLRTRLSNCTCHCPWHLECMNIYMYCVLHQLCCSMSELPLCQVHYYLLLVPHSTSTYCGSCRHHCSNCSSCRTALDYFHHPDLHCYLVSITWNHMTVTWLLHDHKHHRTVTWSHDCHIASSPGPTQKSGKRPGVTCKNSRMCRVSILRN